MTTFAMRIVGPDRFCPDCHRWLVRVHKDGTFDLAAQASVELIGRGTADLSVDTEHEVDLFTIEATCLTCKPEQKAEEMPYRPPRRWPITRLFGRNQ